MENASQALIMAGGILIGIIIISMGVYLLSQVAAIPENYNASLEEQKLAAFNSKFEIYYSSERRNSISGQDIVTAINIAADENKNFTEDEPFYIRIYLNEKIINNYSESQKIELMQNTTTNDTNRRNDFYTFECVGIGYDNTSGRVNSVKFVKK